VESTSGDWHSKPEVVGLEVCEWRVFIATELDEETFDREVKRIRG
jgi:hypothetical protein